MLTIDRDRNVTVEGTLKAADTSRGKTGRKRVPGSGILKIKADGLWHDLPVEDAADNRLTDAGCTACPSVT